VQPEKARLKDSKRDARRLQLARSGLREKGPLMTTSVGNRCRRWPMPIHVGRAGLAMGGFWQSLFSRSLPCGFKPLGRLGHILSSSDDKSRKCPKELRTHTPSTEKAMTGVA
jgi:hypothetical protein